jgi:hypothetical protein
VRLNRIDGEPITPDEIAARIRELASHERQWFARPSTSRTICASI